jgi:hypothetical protein
MVGEVFAMNSGTSDRGDVVMLNFTFVSWSPSFGRGFVGVGIVWVVDVAGVVGILASMGHRSTMGWMKSEHTSIVDDQSVE